MDGSSDGAKDGASDRGIGGRKVGRISRKTDYVSEKSSMNLKKINLFYIN